MIHVWDYATRGYPVGDGELMLAMEVVGERPGLPPLKIHYPSDQIPKVGVFDVR